MININNTSSFTFLNATSRIDFFIESKCIFEMSVSKHSLEPTHSVKPLSTINAKEEFENAIKTPTLQNMKAEAVKIMSKFYKNINISEEKIKNKISQFQAVLEMRTLQFNELLPKNRAIQYYNIYLDMLDHLKDLQDESIKKNGIMSTDGFMLGNNRVESFSVKEPFKAELKNPTDPIAYLKDAKNKTFVPNPENFSREKYPNLSILNLEGLPPIIAKTGIVEIETIKFHDKIIGLYILDGDEDYHLYDARTKKIKIIKEKPSKVLNRTPYNQKNNIHNTSGGLTTLTSTNDLYKTFTSDHYALFANATNKINKQINTLHSQNKSAKFDWDDWGNTPFEINKNGDIVLDLEDWENDTDVVIFTKKELEDLTKTTPLVNAENIVDLLNKNKELLDSSIFDNLKIQSAKKTQDNKKQEIKKTTPVLSKEKSGITETIDTAKNTTTLKLGNKSFTYLSDKNRNNKKFVTENIQLLKNLQKKKQNTFNIIEQKDKQNRRILLINIQNNNYNLNFITGIQNNNKQPKYKFITNDNKNSINVLTENQKFLESHINPFYEHLADKKISKTKRETAIEKQKELQEKMRGEEIKEREEIKEKTINKTQNPQQTPPETTNNIEKLENLTLAKIKSHPYKIEKFAQKISSSKLPSKSKPNERKKEIINRAKTLANIFNFTINIENTENTKEEEKKFIKFVKYVQKKVGATQDGIVGNQLLTKIWTRKIEGETLEGNSEKIRNLVIAATKEFDKSGY